VDTASSSEEEMTRLYNKWVCKLLEIKGLAVPEEVQVKYAVYLFNHIISLIILYKLLFNNNYHKIII